MDEAGQSHPQAPLPNLWERPPAAPASGGATADPARISFSPPTPKARSHHWTHTSVGLPRTAASPPPIARRGYNYQHGNSDRGLLFSCFQRDLEKGFEAVQGRLQGEAVAKYTLTVGGGYYFVPPPGTAWLGALTEA